MRVRAALAASLLVALSSGCADYSELAYRKSDRVRFVAPESRSLVTLPVTLRWIDETPHAGERYAIFIDRAPIRPGHTLEDVAEDDTICVQDPACPDVRYLEDRGVFVTDGSEVTIESVAPLAGSKQEIQRHDANLIILDADGRRIGELSWYVQFKLQETLG